MDLLDRYVKAVNSFLPLEKQDDIVKELSANLQAQMDDREAQLGRPLSEIEQEAILQQHGHPMIVAGHYQINQGTLVFGRQLIGATLFPLYRKALSITLGVSLAICLVILIVLGVSGTPITFESVVNTILLQMVIQFAVVTAIFAAADSYLPRTPWNVQRPPALHPVFRQGQQWQLRPRLESIAEIVAIVVSVWWLWLVFDRPSLLVGSIADTYQLGPIWHQAAPLILLVFSVSLAQAVVTLVRPSWARFRPVLRLVMDIALLGIAVYVLRAGSWVVFVHSTSRNADVLGSTNHYVSYSLLAMVIGVAIVVLIDVWNLLRRTSKRPA